MACNAIWSILREAASRGPSALTYILASIRSCVKHIISSIMTDIGLASICPKHFNIQSSAPSLPRSFSLTLVPSISLSAMNQPHKSTWAPRKRCAYNLLSWVWDLANSIFCLVHHINFWELLSSKLMETVRLQTQMFLPKTEKPAEILSVNCEGPKSKPLWTHVCN